MYCQPTQTWMNNRKRKRTERNTNIKNKHHTPTQRLVSVCCLFSVVRVSQSCVCMSVCVWFVCWAPKPHVCKSRELCFAFVSHAHAQQREGVRCMTISLREQTECVCERMCKQQTETQTQGQVCDHTRTTTWHARQTRSLCMFLQWTNGEAERVRLRLLVDWWTRHDIHPWSGVAPLYEANALVTKTHQTQTNNNKTQSNKTKPNETENKIIANGTNQNEVGDATQHSANFSEKIVQSLYPGFCYLFVFGLLVVCCLLCCNT